MPQHFDATKESRLIEQQCAEILNTGDKGASTALHHELDVLFCDPKKFLAVQKLIGADNASHDLPAGLARVSFKEENGKEYLEFSNAKTTVG
jgi:hypothetical protein